MSDTAITVGVPVPVPEPAVPVDSNTVASLKMLRQTIQDEVDNFNASAAKSQASLNELDTLIATITKDPATATAVDNLMTKFARRAGLVRNS